jgi:hypothetical protein
MEFSPNCPILSFDVGPIPNIPVRKCKVAGVAGGGLVTPAARQPASSMGSRVLRSRLKTPSPRGGWPTATARSSC